MAFYDIECPYCGFEENEYNGDAVDDNTAVDCECSKCNREFTAWTESIQTAYSRKPKDDAILGGEGIMEEGMKMRLDVLARRKKFDRDKETSDALKQNKVPTHKEFQKAVDKSGLRGYKFGNKQEGVKHGK